MNELQLLSRQQSGQVSNDNFQELKAVLTAVLAPYQDFEAQGWENVKLEYLSQVFGISQPDARRAGCDAQANALLYGKIRELAREYSNHQK